MVYFDQQSQNLTSILLSSTICVGVWERRLNFFSISHAALFLTSGVFLAPSLPITNALDGIDSQVMEKTTQEFKNRRRSFPFPIFIYFYILP